MPQRKQDTINRGNLSFGQVWLFYLFGIRASDTIYYAFLLCRIPRYYKYQPGYL